MTDSIESEKQTPVTDSPWFWVTLFCCAALIVLVVAQGQVDQRQVRIERQSQGRQRAAEMKATGVATTEMSTPGNTRITTGPLTLVLAIVLLVAGNMFWLWRWNRNRNRGSA